MEIRRAFLLSLLGISLGLLLNCAREDPRSAEAARRQEEDRRSAAFKAGQVAHELAKDSGKIAAAAGRKIEKSAREAGEGWKEQSKQDREKSRRAREPENAQAPR